MNNNVENSVEETFDEMLDSVKSINDDFVNQYFQNEESTENMLETKENTEFYDEKTLHELTNDMNQELFKNNIPVEKNVENLETSDIPDSELIDLIDKTTNSEEYFDILEGKFNDK